MPSTLSAPGPWGPWRMPARVAGFPELVTYPSANPLRSAQTPKGCVTQRPDLWGLCPTCTRRQHRAQAAGRVQTVSHVQEEGRVQAAGACAVWCPTRAELLHPSQFLPSLKAGLQTLPSIKTPGLNSTSLSLVFICFLHSPWTPTAPVPQVRGTADCLSNPRFWEVRQALVGPFFSYP